MRAGSDCRNPVAGRQVSAEEGSSGQASSPRCSMYEAPVQKWLYAVFVCLLFFKPEPS